MDELKRCPFCGESARLGYGNDSGELFVIVMCNSCGIRTQNFYCGQSLSEGEMMVIKRWNRRAE